MVDKQIHILLVDDEPDIRTIVRIPLEASGYHVVEAENGQVAIDYISSHPDVDLILMDIMMPVMSGVEACSEIRKLSVAPILFLTAKTMESDKLEAYSSGGDDYLGKPFSRGELMMKVNSLLRRYRIYRGKETMDTIAGGIEISDNYHIVKKDGQPIELTDTEYDILLYLYRNKGRVVSAKVLYEEIWKEKYMPSSANTIMVHMLNLRKKLEEDPSNPRIIRTIWGKGYQID